MKKSKKIKYYKKELRETQFVNRWLKSAVLCLIIFLVVDKCEAQGKIAFQGALDGKMLVKGDNAREIPKGTIDGSFRVLLQGNQDEWGYAVVFPEFTYRNTEGNLKSWSINVGYTYNQIVIPRSEITFSLGYGWLDHYGKTSSSWRGSVSYGFKFTEFLKGVIITDLVQRSDLPNLYPKADNEEFKHSIRFGFEFILN